MADTVEQDFEPFETLDDCRAYIEKSRWVFAKSMPQWPHEYTVREWKPLQAEEFQAFVAFIRERGEVKPWPKNAKKPRHHNTYLEIDGWQYWTMGAPVHETTVINRARVDGPGAA